MLDEEGAGLRQQPVEKGGPDDETERLALVSRKIHDAILKRGRHRHDKGIEQEAADDGDGRAAQPVDLSGKEIRTGDKAQRGQHRNRDEQQD
ncbi:hypothetical protein D3C86_2085720 [compost metagenome]